MLLHRDRHLLVRQQQLDLPPVFVTARTAAPLQRHRAAETRPDSARPRLHQAHRQQTLERPGQRRAFRPARVAQEVVRRHVLELILHVVKVEHRLAPEPVQPRHGNHHAQLERRRPRQRSHVRVP